MQEQSADGATREDEDRKARDVRVVASIRRNENTPQDSKLIGVFVCAAGLLLLAGMGLLLGCCELCAVRTHAFTFCLQIITSTIAIGGYVFLSDFGDDENCVTPVSAQAHRNAELHT